MQFWFKIQKQKLTESPLQWAKRGNHLILFIDTENTFDKTEYTFVSQIVKKTRKKGTFST